MKQGATILIAHGIYTHVYSVSVKSRKEYLNKECKCIIFLSYIQPVKLLGCFSSKESMILLLSYETAGQCR